MTDFRALCAELVEKLDDLNCNYNIPNQSALIERARAALAKPEPEGPTDEELLELMPQVMRDDLASVSRLSGAQIGLAAGVFRTTLNVRVLEYARAVLFRWGRPTPQPIPVSERLPGPEYCDAEGLCWWWRTDDSDEWWELLCITDAREYNARCGSARYTHWLPAHALPLPADD